MGPAKLNLYKKHMDNLNFPPLKRKAGHIPSLLTPNCSSIEKKFLVIRSEKGKVAARSPFKIHKELCSVLGGEASGITKLRSGEILVELSSSDHEDKLLALETFGGLPVVVYAHLRLNSSRGVVRSPDLRGTSDDEIVEELDEVTQARRIYRRRVSLRLRLTLSS